MKEIVAKMELIGGDVKKIPFKCWFLGHEFKLTNTRHRQKIVVYWHTCQRCETLEIVAKAR